jgi:hypothetical protein
MQRPNSTTLSVAASRAAAMPAVSRAFYGSAILFLLAGIGVGLHMAASQDHSAVAAHAHTNLLGWVTSALFGIYYALNPQKAVGWLPWLQYGLYTAGLLTMLPALYLLYTGMPEIEPLVAAGSMAVAAGVLLFAIVLFMPARRSRIAASAVPAE